MRPPKCASSSGVSSVTGLEAASSAPSTETASPGVRGKRAGKVSPGRPYCVMPTRVVATRWSATLPRPLAGMRPIVSTTCL